MAKNYCSLCSNFKGRQVENRSVTLHRMPRDKRRKRAWLQRIKLVRKDFRGITSYTNICSEHFVNKKGPIPGDDLPSVFPNKTFKTTKVFEEPEHQSLNNEDDNPATFSQRKLSLPATSLLLHDYCGPVDPATIVNSEKCVAVCQVNTFGPETCSVGTQTDSPTTSTTDCESQTDEYVHHTPMRYEHISENNSSVRLYTGLPNSATFQAVFDELEAAAKSSQQVKVGTNGKGAGRKKNLRPVDEFLLVMMRLKLGLVLADLCFRFDISRSACARTIKKWIDLLYVHMAFLVYWPTREQVNNTMPNDFKDRFPNTRVIIDCTELLTETPRSLADRSMMWSQYKSHMTWKALVGITPNGVVSFVSDLWTGSISDKQIVEKSGILDLCEPGDAIMGDKGFLISEYTTPRQIELTVPPRKANRTQMSQEDTELTRRVANCRIHVERHMERVKNFRILNNLSGTMKSSVSQIWKVCNSLTALLTPLHPHDDDIFPEPLDDDEVGS